MYDKDFDRNYEQWKFLEKFQGWHIGLNKEIVKVCREQGVDLREMVGKALSNMLKNGKETTELLHYATECFSICNDSGYADFRFVGMEGLIKCWYKAYLVKLGEDFWQLKLAMLRVTDGGSKVGYSKTLIKREEIKFDEETGEVVDWNKPPELPMVGIEELRGE